MKRISGIITSEIKLINSSPILVRFEVTDRQNITYNCILHTLALTFLQNASMGSGVTLLVRENIRHQNVVKKFEVFNSQVFI
ncbi:hypothetical protein [Pediococcus claussenii]|uniref:Uncharacterized protein n=1 Tax=Pediococcus claussenii (strain ATCC BAA-344 / DSM 14800 / JCM 18046 / KCTC 3811 / LMG 21948 / P06) TaxID=701521 RepID=G8PET1_PEDCP|nr:hypothetical protein [Pediococcus claussenii]AEV94461.1 hypothetical protein PECL_137 [Pediococcus claussenii ATCC BAA-344]ANZ69680.1 hypothetical protein AYR57_04845 [Pediococcus claussenii]ANZ71497.1 hypothetical protein AYR58_04850 [Pediococcus claussenii]